jgi:hypothetical protein
VQPPSGQGVPAARVRGEDAGVPHLVKPRRGHQGAQAGDEIARRERDRARPVAERALHSIEHQAIVGERQAALCQRWPQGVGRQPLEPVSVVRMHGTAGVQGEPLAARAERRQLLVGG